MPDIGIVIVTYNSQAVIGACLDRALASGAEVVVVDNASSDSTVVDVQRRGVRLIANSSNGGFAAAANQGFNALTSPYILLLNPDVVLSRSLEQLRAACDLPGAAGAGGCLLNPSRKPQTGFMVRRFPTPPALIFEVLLLNRLWPGNPINARYRARDLDYSRLQPVEQPAGAFLMIRRTVWKELGGFDEQFWPLWFEDVDFCRRAAGRGYQFYYVPEAVAKHTGGHSLQTLTLEMKRIYWYGNLLRYSARHFRRGGVRAVCLAVILGSLLRGIVESALERSFRPAVAYRKIAWLALRVLRGDRFVLEK